MKMRPQSCLQIVLSRRFLSVAGSMKITTLFLITCLSPIVGSALASDKDGGLRKAAQRIHSQSILVDGHNDITGAMTDASYDLAEPSKGVFHTDLPRLKAGGVDALFFSIFIDPAKYASNGATTRALKLID